MVEGGSITFRLGLNTDDLLFGIDKAKYSMLEWRGETLKSAQEMTKWGAAIGATVAPVVAVGVAAYATIEKFGAMADEINDLAYTTGLSTTKIQELQYAAVLSGTQFASVTMGVNTLTLAMAKAKDTSSDAGKAFKSLGITTEGKTIDQIFEETTVSLVGMKDETARNEIAVTLYGRSWKEMLPFMQTYIDKAKEIKANPILSKQELADLEDAKISLDALISKVTILEGKAVSKGVGYWDWLTEGYEKAALANPNGLYSKGIVNSMNLHTGQSGSDAYSGQVTNPLEAAVVVNPFASLTGSKADLKLLTDYTLPDLKKKLDEAIAAGDPDKIDEARLAVWKTENQIKDLTATIAKSDKEIARTNRDNKLQLKELTDITIPSLQKAYDAIKFTGAKTDIEKADLALQSAKNSANDLKEALGGVADVADTYNKKFASSMNVSTAQTDWAGYSDLANMTASELQAVIDKAQHGGSKGMADKAQTYLSLMGQSGSPAGASAATTETATATKTTTPGSTEQTAAVKKEYDIQGTALKDLTATVTSEYQKQSEAFKAHLDALTTYRTEQYPALELLDLTHWATSEEIARVAAQKQLDFMATEVNFAGQNPIVQAYIVMSKDGPDWTPPAFVAVTAPTLESADFTKVGASVSAIVEKGLGNGTSATPTIKVEINQAITGVDSTTTAKVTNATNAGINKALAGVTALGGAMN